MSPEMKVQQRMAALAGANEIRTARAVLRKRVKAGEVSIHDLLSDPPECLLSMPTLKFVMWVPSFGDHRARSIIHTAGVMRDPNIHLGRLSLRIRTEISAGISAILDQRERERRGSHESALVG